ncbi:hypothetical protein LIER_18305 [Lithospermum erythrorhizon]|uniref:DDE Tnp4 domain-containing protein n=1 Tax=Lithospermum erythrorhizon TaxID=34254 RepID=A0AAV3QG21_LITER
MEISSIPFSNQEDNLYSSNFFTFNQENFDQPPTMKNQKIGDNDLGLVFRDSFSFEDIFSKLFPGEDQVTGIVDPFQTNQMLDSSSIDNNVFRFKNEKEFVFDQNPGKLSHKRSRGESSDDLSVNHVVAGGGQRRCWMKNRSKAWWEQIDSSHCPEEEFKKAFRMRKSTFEMICRELEHVVNKKDTMLRQAIPVRQRVAVCIWRLATGEPLREVSKRFGLGISTCHKLVLQVCKAFQDVLKPKFLNWPNDRKMQEVKSEFENISGIGNVGGVLYTTHVPIIAPKDKVAMYYNKKHTERNNKASYSVTVQGVVNHKGIFTDVLIGWPGSMSDEKVLEKSSIFQRGNMGLMKDAMLVGNSGHPLMDWVLVPYTQQHLTWTQHAFNEKIEEVQKIGQDAFMRMKARWACLQKRTETKLQDLPLVLMACCVLHNICEMNNEGLSPELKFELFDDEMVAENGVRSVNASHYRDHVAHKLLHFSFAGTNSL